ncbi:MAG: ABC transporter ATP-binding protein [Alphaproteobacteria bacterium]
MSERKKAKSFELDTATKLLAARLWRDWIKQHVRRLGVAMVLMAIVAGTTSLYPLMIDWSYTLFQKKDPAGIYILPIALLVITAVKGLSFYGQVVQINWISLRIVTDMQNAMFDRLLGADLARIQNEQTGNLLSRFTNDTNIIYTALNRAFNNLMRDTLTVAALVSVMFYLDWLLSLVALVIYPVAAIPIIRIGQRVRKASKNAQKQIGGLASLLNESFAGARMVKSYRLENYERARANKEFESRFSLVMRLVRNRSWIEPLMEVLGGLAIGGVLALVGWRLLNGEDTLGQFTGFVTALLIAAQPMRALGTLNTVVQEGLAAVQRVFDLLDELPEITEKPNAVPLANAAGGILLDNVSFSYGDEIQALAKVTIEIKPNTTVALVGPSGAGKSTIFNLIPRLYDASQGRVGIGGQDVGTVTLASLRDAIAVVSQDVTLFNDTIRTNISFGCLDATDEQIIEAAKSAAAHEFILSLPEGYDTVVGDRGMRLSGGERQRISLARAVLKNAPILLLDEATSSLDSESEAKVQTALDALKRQRTTLVIAHRLSTVRDADKICVLDKGQVVETGTHQTLLKNNGLYARLCQLQFRDDAKDSV